LNLTSQLFVANHFGFTVSGFDLARISHA
jgi:hypothetical protein